MCTAAPFPVSTSSASQVYKIWQNHEIQSVFGGSFEGVPITVMRKSGDFFATFARCRLPELRALLRSMNAVGEFKVVRLQSLNIHLVDVAPVDSSGEPLSPTGFMTEDAAFPIITSGCLISHLMKPYSLLVVGRLIGRPQFKLTLLADGEISLPRGEIAMQPVLRFDGVNPDPYIDFQVWAK